MGDDGSFPILSRVFLSVFSIERGYESKEEEEKGMNPW